MAVTYAEARAACVARYGEPSEAYAIGRCARAWWGRNGSGVVGVLLAETHRGVELSAIGYDDPQRWTLAGTPCAGAPLTPLPAALDAADAFLRAHAHPTKGP